MRSSQLSAAVSAGLLMCAAASASAQTVTSFTAVNADTGADIATFSASGAVSIADTPRISIRANASGASSVRLSDGTSSRLENSAPFTLKGDSGGVYAPWTPALGTYLITATPYTGVGGTGTAGAVATLNLTITGTATPKPPVVNAGVDQNLPVTRTAILRGSASDPDGTVVAYSWSQISGPSQSIIAMPTSDSSRVTELVKGVYTFRLTARDNDGNVASDDVTIRLGQTTARTRNLIIDPDNKHYFVYDRDDNSDGRLDPAYLAGAGGPEGFLYMDNALKQSIITKLLTSPTYSSAVNGLYFHSTRAFGGDDKSNVESPFITPSDQRSGIDLAKLDSWYVDLKRLDDAGVILWFTLFDDHSIPFGCNFNDDYKNYATTIVNRFKDLKHLVWITQEEFNWQNRAAIDCTSETNRARQIGLAAAIRAADPVHPIGTHHMNGQTMQFNGEPNIRVFAQQTSNPRATGVDTPEEMHSHAGGEEGWGDHVYVMAEANTWHKDLLAAGDRTTLRRSHWATAMAGGSVMSYAMWEGSPILEPTHEMLDDLRRLRTFMESTLFNRMAPLFATTLAGAKLDNTKYILANQSEGLFILYGEFAAGNMGVKGAPAGTYALKWFDPASGQTVDQTQTVAAGGSASFTKPASIGNEVVLYLRKQ